MWRWLIYQTPNSTFTFSTIFYLDRPLSSLDQILSLTMNKSSPATDSASATTSSTPEVTTTTTTNQPSQGNDASGDASGDDAAGEASSVSH